MFELSHSLHQGLPLFSGEVPEWVEDDVGDDPGTFDSSGAFVSTKDVSKADSLQENFMICCRHRVIHQLLPKSKALQPSIL